MLWVSRHSVTVPCLAETTSHGGKHAHVYSVLAADDVPEERVAGAEMSREHYVLV